MGEYVDGGLIISVLSGLFFCVGDAMPYLPQMALWDRLGSETQCLICPKWHFGASSLQFFIFPRPSWVKRTQKRTAGGKPLPLL